MSLTLSILFAATIDRLGPAAQQVGDLVVAGARARARASTTKHRDVGVVERGLGLLADRAGERVLVGEVDAAGVDERELAAVPLGRRSRCGRA